MQHQTTVSALKSMPTLNRSHRTIVTYYDQCFWHYRLVWFNRASLAMHLGYWDDQTYSHSQALLNMNRRLAAIADVQPGESILDAGCGVGGSAIWLAKRFDVHVAGITLSEDQARRARRYAVAQRLANKVQFLCQDYAQTAFLSGTFDLIWAIESVCHSNDKVAFLTEARRLLKPRGRLVIADGWATETQSARSDLMQSWLKGWAVPVEHFVTSDAFLDCLADAGFGSIAFTDITPHILPASRRLYRLSLYSYPLARLLAALKVCSRVEINNVLAARDQYRSLSRGLWRYGIVYAGK